MSSNGCFSVLKSLALLLLLLAIPVPIYYDSTDPKQYRAFENLLQSVPIVD